MQIDDKITDIVLDSIEREGGRVSISCLKTWLRLGGIRNVSDTTDLCRRLTALGFEVRERTNDCGTILQTDITV